MAIKVGGTTVIDDGRALNNITSVDATTVAALGTAGVGGGGGSADFTATGSISSGDVVGLNSDGTISVIEKNTLSATSLSTFTTVGNPSDISSTYHIDANKVVLVYKDGSTGHLMLTHGAVSGDAISFSTPTTLEAINVNQGINCFYEDMYRTVVILYRDGNNLKSTSYSFNSGGNGIQGPVVTGASNQKPLYLKAAWNKKEGRIFASYEDFISHNLELASWVYERRNSSNTLPNVYNDRITLLTDQDPSDSALTYDESADCVLVCFSDSTDSSKGKIIAFRDANSYGSNSQHEENNKGTKALYPGGFTSVQDSEIIYDPSSKSSFVFFKTGSVNRAFACRVDPLTLNIEVGPVTTVSSVNSTNQILQISPKTGEILLAYNVSGANKAHLLSVDPSSLTITVNSSANIHSSVVNNSIGNNIAYDPYTNRFILAIADSSSSNHGKTLFIKPELASKEISTCIGVAAENISNASTGEVTISGGINEAMTSLTAGKTYYLNYKGEVTIEPSDVELGKALSSTKMLLNVKELNGNVVLKEAGENIYSGQPVCLGRDSKVYPVVANYGTYTKSNLSIGSNFTSTNTVYDPLADVFVMAYRSDVDGSGYFVNVTINTDETLTFGTPVKFTTGNNSLDNVDVSMVYDPSTGYVVMVYLDANVGNYRVVSYKASTTTVGSTLTVSNTSNTSCNASIDIGQVSNDYNVEDAAIYVATNNGNDLYVYAYRINSSGTLTLNGYSYEAIGGGELRSLCLKISGSVGCIVAAASSDSKVRVFRFQALGGSTGTIYTTDSYFQVEGRSYDSGGVAASAEAKLQTDYGVRLVAYDDATFVMAGSYNGGPFLVPIKFTNPNQMQIPPHKGVVKRVTAHFNIAYSSMYIINDSIYLASAGNPGGVFLSARFNPDNLDTLEITDLGYFPVNNYARPFSLAHIPHKDKSIVLTASPNNKASGFIFKPVRNYDFIGFAKENINKGSSGKILTEGGVARGVNSLPSNDRVKLLANGSLVPPRTKTTSGITIGTSLGKNEIAVNKGNL